MGEHQEFAAHYIEKHYSEFHEKSEIEMDVLDLQVNGCCGDKLQQNGWILLHSPCQGIAQVTRDLSKHISKPQMKFLYDYYKERNMNQEADKYVDF